MNIDVSRLQVHSVEVEKNLRRATNYPDPLEHQPAPHHWEDMLHVRVVLTVNDVDNPGTSAKIYHDSWVIHKYWLDFDEYRKADYIHRQVCKALEHEVDECLFVNRKRVHEPHKEK